MKSIVLAGFARTARAKPLSGGPLYPVFTGGTSTFWAQGISAGLQLRF